MTTLYRVKIEDVAFYNDYIEDIGAIYDYVDYDLAVIAETRGKARIAVVKFLRSQGAKYVDYMSDMSIHKQNETTLETTPHGVCWFWGSCDVCAKPLIFCTCTDAEIEAWELEHGLA